MNLNNIVIVLSRPEESRNIGAVCRAMANSGISCLRIVGKKEDIDEERVRILAIHAANIYENATFYSSITEATADCVCAAGTTRRRGKKRMNKLLLPEEFASLADSLTSGKVAVVFGNERTGLEDDELLECTMGVTIPSCDTFPSLNLSHAVQLVCYHLFRQKNSSQTGYTPLSLERIDRTVKSIADNLQKIGFFVRTGRPQMEMFWRNMLSRAATTEGEAQYIEKIFTKAAALVEKNQSTNIMSSGKISVRP
ncbi:MAG: RNA methyltransferase [Treponema sp.]|nr:RNA methyltransferase [Treponema sp.]